ncbi:MAG TPA: RNA-binding protein [Lachnospiraceae bacterium]|nr:RNA-binding protein [Lachnospiraceae bacterium]
MNADETIRRHLMDLAARAYSRNIVVYSDFLDLHELHILQCLPIESMGASLSLSGGYEAAERQMAAFLPDALIFEADFPMDCVSIAPMQEKYAEPLTHRDYLGALMHIGIERSCLGDILMDGTKAYVFCVRKMTPVILNEISRVRHTSVKTFLERPETIPAPKYKEVSGTVSSVRLDSVAALAFGLSRNRTVPYIEGGSVYVNGRQILSNGYALQEGDRISVRGVGKCQYLGMRRQSKKGKQWIDLLRYI